MERLEATSARRGLEQRADESEESHKPSGSLESRCRLLRSPSRSIFPSQEASNESLQESKHRAHFKRHNRQMSPDRGANARSIESHPIRRFILLSLLALCVAPASSSEHRPTRAQGTGLGDSSQHLGAAVRLSQPSVRLAGAAETRANGHNGKNEINLQQQVAARGATLKNLQNLEQRLERRSPLDLSVDSADLPAEFRGGDDSVKSSNDAPQSKLAKLCQQTSSVLASVLPAPFGGHKRSILCQFFGQVQLGSHSNKRPPSKALASGSGPNHSMPGVAPAPSLLLRQNEFPLPSMLPANEPHESIAVIHQHQQTPITMVATGRHPIELVLEHQQRLAAMQAQQQQRLPNLAGHQRGPLVEMPARPPQRTISVTKQQVKFSAPLVTVPFGGVTASARPSEDGTAHSNAWRIFNTTLIGASEQTTSTTPSAFGGPNSTTGNVTEVSGGSGSLPRKEQQRSSLKQQGDELADAASEVISISQLVPSQLRPSAASEQEPRSSSTSGVKHLQIGKRTSATPKSVTSGGPNELEGKDKSDQQSKKGLLEDKKLTKGESDNHRVRTIEVVAVEPDKPRQTIMTNVIAAKQQHDNKTTNNSTNNAGSAGKNQRTDLHQVQKREELVIASINNLTRIAFGNQLRDTVKVINRLIDQQADLFTTTVSSRANKHSDPMLASESKHSLQTLDETEGEKSSAVTGKLKLRKSSSQVAAGKEQQQQQSAAKSSHEKPTQISPTTHRPTTKRTSRKQSTGAPASANQGRPRRPAASGELIVNASSATTSGRSDRRTTQKLELRRLNAASATSKPPQAASNSRPATELARAAGSTRSSRTNANPLLDSLASDLIPMPTISDLNRRSPFGSTTRSTGAATGWIPAREPPRRKHDQQAEMRRPNGLHSRESKGNWAESRTPWLIPDNQPLLAASSSVTRSLSSLAPISTASSELRPMLMESPAPQKRWMATTGTAKTFPKATARMSNPSINSIQEHHSKETRTDSLTILKMSLLSSTTTTTTSTTARPSTSGIQSRWIPTTMFVTSQPQMSISSTAETTTTSKPATFPTTIISDTPSSVAKEISSDLIDSQASDSISKYTSHHLMNEEALLSTTRRMQLFQQQQQQLQTASPQIAQTGDFFSSETIASWPEKYQTMIERQDELQHSSRTKTTTMSMALNSETTRRNGEFYDEGSTLSSANGAETTPALARHKLTNDDNQHQKFLGDGTTKSSNLGSTILANSPRITILPSNHKLSSAGENNDLVTINNKPTTLAQDSGWPITRTETSQTMLPLDHSADESDNSLLPKTTTKHQIAAYTLVDLAIDQQNGQVSNHNALTSIAPLNPAEGADREHPKHDYHDSANDSNDSQMVMKPPYHENAATQADSNLMLVLDSNQSRPNVAKKLYESITPSPGSEKNFDYHSSNSSRFSLSALKYLAQNLLGSHPGLWQAQNLTNSNGSEPLFANNIYKAQFGPSMGEHSIIDHQQAIPANQARLLEMLASTIGGVSNSSSYYELYNNENITHDGPHSTNVDRNVSSSSGGFFGRAGNLLHDLKQFEQRRAAALLAAIRHQVPGPLVRPWDLASDLMTPKQPNSTNANLQDRIHERRHDGNRPLNFHSKEGAPSALNFLSSLLSRPSRLRQILVGREELEARLNVTRAANADKMRRSDGIDDLELRESDLMDLQDTIASMNNETRLKDLEYLLGVNERVTSENQSISFGKSVRPRRKDFETIDLSSSETAINNDTTGVEHYPKYIRMLEYQTAWTQKPGESRKLATFAMKRQPAAEIAERLHNARTGSTSNSHIPITKVQQHQSIHNIRSHQETYHEDESKPRHLSDPSQDEQPGTGRSGGDKIDFDCTNRRAGFYPDIGTSCRTFYHCSDTGHLLTFNCPTQTRFDETSLRCGTWYEVPCDAGRVRVSSH